MFAFLSLVCLSLSCVSFSLLCVFLSLVCLSLSCVSFSLLCVFLSLVCLSLSCVSFSLLCFSLFLILFLFLLTPPPTFLCLLTPYIFSVPAKPLPPTNTFSSPLDPLHFSVSTEAFPLPVPISLFTEPPSLPIEPPFLLADIPTVSPYFSYCSPSFLSTLLFYKILIDLLRNHILQQSSS
ncbi:unnamed protein product [Acanthosepion pharaonis]|uniref:Uncharacterized protein n=1 Tax=Acanthosepion pharaonis TaxID=158019 RepID=A0A812D2G5_ACAPH|nr:unnamed protein product [Sepia pharaonis]